MKLAGCSQQKKDTLSLTRFAVLPDQSVRTSVRDGASDYPNAFVSKLSDADAESAETQVWLEFASKCGYLEKAIAQELDDAYSYITGKLVNMINHADQWAIRYTKDER